ncbi:hypothetical protein A3K34_01755 [candidate division WWE3 bacterium RIFOXYC1_FULL_40_10]|uniref:Uncharacterized protein n=1 Tax=candidate division WWE3 bacterium RIFOXYA2_FULL_46_9 TaxID=1802636 RepID=A0A1F4W2Q4_UNCKA|nr:MAG: hypothetical protein A3K58_01755 [candidate division WWE3 bacterium RIFOXYB1_FULL_40_22]OGC61588.1 MAG: hypothetical protein A3K37_01755 [candidate division WWE3 bacterium RIFOXYA1_FULL_40_11]OGC63635.1 MAG: hypothetical protein A2264_04700 [candidate division WWE3 bacterium RIFOXYA2_FULL_46_9]OGC64734.1 MAG: hypothetical protein A2326_01695 [candidate division WWE3 bacterium RIFOXYB2_FULL_41_6]OGC65971.1 MAG: hypothetical protein A3K34_01755 [candidate division WWE3 bacterium RIFOXYC1_
MPKKLLSLILSLILLAYPVVHTFAADFALTKIGAMDLGGKMYSEWWYTGTFPTFFGTGTPDATIVLTMQGDSYQTKVNSSGDWSYSTNLPKGDFPIELVQDTQKISFTLHLGQSVPTTTPATTTTPETTSTVPDTGIDQIASIAFASGIILLAGYFYFWGDTRRHTSFEQKIIKDN